MPKAIAQKEMQKSKATTVKPIVDLTKGLVTPEQRAERIRKQKAIQKELEKEEEKLLHETIMNEFRKAKRKQEEEAKRTGKPAPDFVTVEFSPREADLKQAEEARRAGKIIPVRLEVTGAF